MYHGKMDQGIERQALHCMELILLILYQRNGSSDFPLAEDMKSVDDTL